MMKKTIRKTLLVDPEVHQQLRKLAVDRRVTVSQLADKLIARGIREVERRRK